MKVYQYDGNRSLNQRKSIRMIGDQETCVQD